MQVLKMVVALLVVAIVGGQLMALTTIPRQAATALLAQGPSPAPAPESWLSQIGNFTATAIMGIALLLTLYFLIPTMQRSYQASIERIVEANAEAMKDVGSKIEKMLIHCSGAGRGGRPGSE